MKMRPKHVDIDKPVGYTKRKLRRWYRHFIQRMTRAEVLEALS